jgi:rubrerythrin
MTIETVPCTTCGTPTRMLGTKLCDPCWELRRLEPQLEEIIARTRRETLDLAARLVELNEHADDLAEEIRHIGDPEWPNAWRCPACGPRARAESDGTCEACGAEVEAYRDADLAAEGMARLTRRAG